MQANVNRNYVRHVIRLRLNAITIKMEKWGYYTLLLILYMYDTKNGTKTEKKENLLYICKRFNDNIKMSQIIGWYFIVFTVRFVRNY